ncbi:transglycosylase domain-containing protein [Rhizobium sp. L1K21]|uniref:transglycosylase domain-containing protein n=1 Tax=Rhizobium sp. L1K21 TaxID=2954933 RepID=UPI0020934E6D|nr:transglycosylase domain-containing protein [Rhizobium sp. L1K21]MCO6184763.1 penicillin-binding protein [Rhizobium sp. L1K21]
MAKRSRSTNRIEPFFESNGNSANGGGSRVTGNARGKKAKKKRARSSGGVTGFLRSAVYWSLVLGLWGAMGVGGIVVYYGAKMPSATSWSIPDRPPNIKILAVDGSTIANRGATGGEAVTLDNMSPYIPEAVISIEDRRFYYHFGFDPIGFARAMVTNILSGHMVQGGSTLTQQLAKNLFLSPERTLERKVQEVLLAIWLEHKFTKDQILAMYLNRVYFGSNAYGVEAASRRYFNKPARDVNLGEAALLAGLLKAPSRLSPARDPKAAEERAQVVLAAMHDAGYVTDKEVTTAMSQKPVKTKSYWSGAGQYVADIVMDRIPSMVGDVKEDLVIDTTIDLSLEEKAEEAIQNALDSDGEKYKVSQAALVSLDGTGAVRALVGGRDYSKSQFDRATDAKRQPGSAFKPFVYAAALEEGVTPDSLRNDAPVKIGKWTPENYENKYIGPVTVQYALTHSLNTIAAQLVMEAGPQQVVKLAHRLGIESKLQENASIALGTSEVSLEELTGAYAAFMNGGYKATPHIIRRISTASGKVLYENRYDDPPRVLSPQIAATMNSMLSHVVSEGTGRAAQIKGWQVAGKTGTTQSYRDALFVGYTSNLATGVWFGNDDGTPMKRATGGSIPARTWQEFMAAAHEGLSPSPLFGTGGGYSDGTPMASVPTTQDGTGVSSPPSKPRTLTDVLSDLLGTNKQASAELPPSSNAPPAPLPPASVGTTPQAQQNGSGKKSTLLDVLMGG